MERVSEASGNGNGFFHLEKILTHELRDKCSLYARVTVPPGVSVSDHKHEGNGESYFFLKGSGTYTEDGVSRPISAGDSTWTPSGSSHGLENTGSEDLVFMALIVND